MVRSGRAANTKTYLTVAEAAKALRISERLFRDYVRSGQVKALKFGTKPVYRITEDALEQFARERMV